MTRTGDQLVQPIDYESLRHEAMGHIARYTSDTWTDYNTHDPGITIAEILCFALTELGLRANLPIEDILAERLNAGEAGFYPAHEILTNLPLTEDDYRKLLIDLDGVKNVWLTESEGHHSPIYVNTLNGQLTLMSETESCYYRKCNSVACTITDGASPVPAETIKKRFENKYVLVTRIDYQSLFDQYETLEDLTFTFSIGAETGESLIVERDVGGGISFNQDNLDSRDKFNELYNDRPFIDCTVETTRPLDEDEAVLAAGLVASLKAAAVDPLKIPFLQIFRNHDYLKSITFQSEMTATRDGKTENAWLRAFTDVNGALCFTSQEDKHLVCRGYYRVDVELEDGFPKHRFADKLADIRSHLDGNRNLCELFPEVNIVDDEYVYICFDIDVKNHADVEAVLSEVVYRLDRHINPDIHFYSLKQMREKGHATEEIFSGPLLQHGFIDEDELQAAVPKDALYASDLIQEIMNAEHVVAVRKLMMSSYHVDASGKLIPVQQDKDWILPLDATRSTKLLISYTAGDREHHSQFRAYKGYLPYCICPKKLLHNVNVRKSREQPLPFTAADLVDAPIQGQSSALAQYFSIRNHFPANYALKDGELPDSATNERKAKVLQLRAFLLFFDQLLANAFSQLSRVGDLLAFESVDRTYCSQLTENRDALEALLTLTPEEYLSHVQECSESTYLFDRRRNRFLDHLLARFAEEFNEYYALADHVYGDLSKQRQIRNKERILQNIVPWSAERFAAENIAVTDMTPLNLSGLEYRLRVFLGMAVREFRDSAFQISTAGDVTTVTFRDDDRSYLSATSSGLSESLLADIAASVMSEASHMTITVWEDEDGQFLYGTSAGYQGVRFASPGSFDTREEAEKARQECLEFFVLRAKYQAGLNQSNLTLLDSDDLPVPEFRFSIADRQNEFLISNAFADTAERRTAVDVLFSALRQLRDALREQTMAAIEDLLDSAEQVDFDDRGDVIRAVRELMEKSPILGSSDEQTRAKSISRLLYAAKQMPGQRSDKRRALQRLLSKHGAVAVAVDLATEAVLDAAFDLLGSGAELAGGLRAILAADSAYTHLTPARLDDLILSMITILKDGRISHDRKHRRLRELLDDAQRLAIPPAGAPRTAITFTLSDTATLTTEKVQSGARWSFTITLNSTVTVVLESTRLFDSEHLMEIALYEAVGFLADFDFLNQMYLVEHILLLLNDSVPAQTLPVHLDAEGEIVTGFDPYSFRLTLVLPGETELLGNMHFRQYFEKFIRQATPSHLFPKICWVSNEQMLAFEEAYSDWRRAWVGFTRDCQSAARLDDARVELIAVLTDLESVYDEAILGGGACDCDGEDKPAVVLGHTKLGSKRGG